MSFNAAFLSLSLFLTFNLYADQINPKKQEQWDAMSAEVDRWVDGIGCPIDQEIKETVIALNLLGIETTGSCEGHTDHGCFFPWIDIENYPPEITKIIQELSEIVEQINNEEIALKAKFPSLSLYELFFIPEGENLKALSQKRLDVSEFLNQKRMACLEPLYQLLDEFYEERKVTYDNIIILPVDFCRLQSIGANRQCVRSPEEKLRKLNNYREEMKAFTIFLKKKFFYEN